MTDTYRATPEQWADTEHYAAETLSAYSCVLELRARIEALEAAQAKVRSGPESPLVERVADAIAAQATSAGIVNDRPARAAILEVAAWLTENYARDVASPPPCQMLRNEVNQ
jgi:hypothetical protein